MDFSTLIGIALALFGVIGGQWLEGGQIGSLVQSTAFLIVVFGTLGAVLLQNPLPVFLRAVHMGRYAFMPPVLSGERVINEVVEWANAMRREGILALDSRIAKCEDPLARAGLQMLVDGFDGASIHAALEVEMCTMEQIDRDSIRVWEAAGGYAPTVGILGAVLGLIHVMENLADPTKLGTGIAVAFVATVYGVALANLVFLPIAGKLKLAARVHSLKSELFQDGLVGMANGEHPRLIATRLRGYLAR